MDGDDLLNTVDVAKLIGVSRQRAHQLIQERDDFPTPVATVGKRTKVWRRTDVVAWVSQHGYDIAEAPPR